MNARRFSSLLAVAIGATAIAPASAQVVRVTGFPNAGVVISGEGSVTAPADALLFDVRLASPFAKSASGAPAASPTSIGDVEAPARALAAALTAAGARDVTIGFQNTIDATNLVFEVDGRLDKPTHDKILTLVVSGGLATTPNGAPVAVQSVRGELVSDSCRTLLARADALAYEDAQRRTRELATREHLALGAVRSAVAIPSGDCPGDDANHLAGASRLPGAAFDGPLRSSTIPLDGPYVVRIKRSLTLETAIR